MTSDSGTYGPESSRDLPDFSQFYTSRVNNEAEHDGQSHAELMDEAVAIARDAWQPDSKYEILDVIALGGMGCILRARDLAAQREVAMKVVLRANGDLELIDRFTREARIVAHLEHPNIVPVHDIGWSIHGDPYFTMTWVQGANLYDLVMRLKDGDGDIVARKPLRSMLEDFGKLCDATAFAHSRGIIHLDLKPNNVMIGDYGEVILLDWGLAKQLSRETPQRTGTAIGSQTANGSAPTRDGIIRGTPGFMAPEQAEGNVAQQDERTDIYSLGAILYMILTHKCPIVGETPKEMIRQTRRGTIVPPGQRTDHAIPPELEAVVMKSMAQNPAQRYQKVEDLRADIEAYLAGYATSVEGAGLWKRSWLLFKRNRWEASLIATSIAIISLLIVAFFFALERRQQMTAWDKRYNEALEHHASIVRAEAQRQENLVSARDGRITELQQTSTRYSYAYRLRLATAALKNQRYDAVMQELDLCPATARHWEWGRLRRQADRLIAQIDTGGPLRAMAAGSNGEQVVTAGPDGSVVVWNTAADIAEAELGRVTAGTRCLALDSSGRIVTGSDDGLVRTWRGSEFQTLGSQDGAVTCIAASKNGRVIVAGSENGTLRAWTGDDFGNSHVLPDSHTNAVTALAINRRWLVSLDAVGEARIHDLRNRRHETLAGRFVDIGFVRHTPHAFTVTADGSVTFWDVKNARTVMTMNENTGPVTAVAAIKGVLAAGSSDGTIRIWDIGLQSLRHTFSGQGEAITRVVLTDAGTVTSTDAAGRIKVWRIANDAMPRTYRRHTGDVRCLAYSPNGRRLASGSNDGMVYLWPRKDTEAIPTLHHETTVAAVVFLDNNRLLAAAGNNAWIWTLDSKLAPIECNGHADLVTAAAAAADGRSILTGSLDGSARLWKTDSGQALQTFNQHQGAVRTVAFLPDSRQAVSAGDDGNVRFWDVTTGAATGGFDGGTPVSVVAVSVQGLLAVGYRDGSCEVRQLDSTLLWRQTRHDAAVTDMIFSADGRRLFSGSADRLTRVWEVSDGNELFAIPGKNPVHAMALSPDNLKLALAGSGRDVRVWQALPWFDTSE